MPRTRQKCFVAIRYLCATFVWLSAMFISVDTLATCWYRYHGYNITNNSFTLLMGLCRDNATSRERIHHCNTVDTGIVWTHLQIGSFDFTPSSPLPWNYISGLGGVGCEGKLRCMQRIKISGLSQIRTPDFIQWWNGNYLKEEVVHASLLSHLEFFWCLCTGYD